MAGTASFKSAKGPKSASNQSSMSSGYSAKINSISQVQSGSIILSSNWGNEVPSGENLQHLLLSHDLLHWNESDPSFRFSFPLCPPLHPIHPRASSSTLISILFKKSIYASFLESLQNIFCRPIRLPSNCKWKLKSALKILDLHKADQPYYWEYTNQSKHFHLIPDDTCTDAVKSFKYFNYQLSSGFL